MTTLWAEGFEDSSSAALAAELGAVNFSLTTGRHAGKVGFGYSGAQKFTKVFGGTASTIFVSFAFKPGSFTDPGVSYPVIQFLENSTPHVTLVFKTTGAIDVQRNASLLGTVSGIYAAGVWKWIQIKIVIHDTTGSVEIKDASGVTLLSLTSIDTKNGGTGFINSMIFGRTDTTVTRGVIDDIHIWDTTGSICNTWTNDTRIDSIAPNGAGAATDWTPSAGSNYQCVDEMPDNTTDYVTSATAAQQDLYIIGSLPHNPSAIFSVTKSAVGQKDDAGARSLKLLARNGGTTYAGAAQTLNLGVDARFLEVLEADPATSTAWTPATLATAQFGIENV